MKEIMQNVVDWFQERENITLLIAVISLLLSVWQWISEAFRKRTNVKIDIIDYTLIGVKDGVVAQFYVQITNKSLAPIAITSVSFENVVCELEPHRIRGGNSPANTPLFPLNISPRSAQSFYLEFVGVPNISLKQGKTVDFEIHSTWKSERKSVLLGNISHYLHANS